MRQSISMIVCIGCAAMALLVARPSDSSAQVGIKRGGFYPGGSILNDNLGYQGSRATSSSSYTTRNQYVIPPVPLVVGAPPANGTLVPQPLSIIDGRGSIEVHVPANAEVFWNGTKSTLTGASRLYRTLPLAADGAVQNFEARWIGPNGQPVSRRFDVRAMPNKTVNADFTRPEPDGKSPATN